MRLIAAKDEPVVFLLWGSYAQKKAGFVQSVEQGGKHLVLKAPHPSPLSAHNGFFGCQHFSKTNAFLEAIVNLTPIDWSLPDGLAYDCCNKQKKDKADDSEQAKGTSEF